MSDDVTVWEKRIAFLPGERAGMHTNDLQVEGDLLGVHVRCPIGLLVSDVRSIAQASRTVLRSLDLDGTHTLEIVIRKKP